MSTSASLADGLYFSVKYSFNVQVVAVGSGKADDKGNVVKSSLSVGDTVLYSKYSGVEFEVGSLLHSE